MKRRDYRRLTAGSQRGFHLEFPWLVKARTGKSVGPSLVKDAKDAKNAKCPTLASLTGVTKRH
jgi:hypothetical protein